MAGTSEWFDGGPGPSARQSCAERLRGPRPLSQTLLVLTAVSSINTAGRGQACLALGCSSGAREPRRLDAVPPPAGFFEGAVVSVEKTPELAAAGANPPLQRLCNGLLQSQARLFGNQSHYPRRVLFQRRNASSARLRCRAPGLLPALQPPDRRVRADLKTLGRLAPRRFSFHRFGHLFPQVTRIGPRHFWLPKGEPMHKDALIHNPLGIPRFKSAGNGSLVKGHRK